MRASILTLISALLPVWATNIYGTIRWNDVCPGFEQLEQSKVILDNGLYAGTVTRDGNFVISDVPSGTYVLSVLSHDFLFDQLRIDISSNATLEARPYIAGTPLDPPSQVLLPVPLVLTPRQKNAYFIPPGSFNLLSMFSNPMMLLMVVTACMMLGAPYLLKNMDAETLRHDKGSHTNNASHLAQPASEGSQKATSGGGKGGISKKANKRKS
ncbi:hypothetical protein APHAL10511_006242 [Amanita phalloides]|nr:hypothetical protein APHAL10511_006242 [Amanita phalloides]